VAESHVEQKLAVVGEETAIGLLRVRSSGCMAFLERQRLAQPGLSPHTDADIPRHAQRNGSQTIVHGQPVATKPEAQERLLHDVLGLLLPAEEVPPHPEEQGPKRLNMGDIFALRHACRVMLSI
jgi:hypothetical protein